jgi:hypothetical protein
MTAKRNIGLIMGLCIGLSLPGVAMSDSCPELQLLREECREDVQAARDYYNYKRDGLDKAFRKKKKELHENGWLTREEIDRAYAERKKHVDNPEERNRLTDAEMKEKACVNYWTDARLAILDRKYEELVSALRFQRDIIIAEINASWRVASRVQQSVCRLHGNMLTKEWGCSQKRDCVPTTGELAQTILDAHMARMRRSNLTEIDVSTVADCD